MRNTHLITILALAGVLTAAPADDKVDFLPYTNATQALPFDMYSGYLPINGTKKSLHYVFAES